jgi:hypothetical protein
MPRPVAGFYVEFMGILRALGVDIEITMQPVETPIHVPFDQDQEHASYDAEYVNRWWRILAQTDVILQRFRSRFRGKSSPPLFYWGSFDLAGARYSGRPIPSPAGPSFYRLAEDEENFACGFWPGNPTTAGETYGQAAFDAYLNPAPEGLSAARIGPEAAHFDTQLGEFILRYDDVRLSPSPDDAVLEFFRGAYDAGPSLGHWDRERLERSV